MRRSRLYLCVRGAVLGLTLAFLWLAAPGAFAQASPSAKGPVSFINDVAPLLKDNCFACHNARQHKGKLDMSTFEGLRRGGGPDDPIVAGKPNDSELFERITADDDRRMPPRDGGEALTREQVAVIEEWIKEGAKLDAGLGTNADLLQELRLRWKPPTPPAAYRYPVNVNAVVFTPDNQELIAGGYHELTVWDVAGGKLKKRLYTRAERAYALAFLPDGKLAVAGGRPGQEGDVRIYNLQADRLRMEHGVAILDGVNDPTVLVKELIETDDSVLCLALSPDGKQLAAGGCDRLIRVWDLSGGYGHPVLEQTIENHADWVMGVVFSPDGKRLLTASRDKTAKVWDLAARESVLTFSDHQTDVYDVAVSRDGRLGYSVGKDNMLRVWRAAGDGKQVRAAGGHGDLVVKVLRHPGQPLLVTCSHDKTVRIWNADNGSPVRVLSGHSDVVYALAISPDGNLIASGGWNGEVKVWKVADGSLVQAFNASPGLQQVGATPPAKQ